MLLDFEHVSGLDSTALMSFVKLSQCAAERGVGLVLCGMDERIADSFRREAELASLRRFADIDRAIEWCEEAAARTRKRRRRAGRRHATRAAAGARARRGGHRRPAAEHASSTPCTPANA